MRTSTLLEVHEIAKVFKPLEGKQFDELVEDIKKHGQRIVGFVFEGKVLIGQNRQRACFALGKRFNRQPFMGDYQDAINFVSSVKLKRSHYTDRERVDYALKLMDLMKQKPCGNRSKSSEKVNVRNKVAKMMNVNPSSLAKARYVRGKSPDIYSKFLNGDQTISKSYADTKREVMGLSKPNVGGVAWIDQFSNPISVIEFAKQISLFQWSCNIRIQNGKFEVQFLDENPCPGSVFWESSLVKAMVYAMHPKRAKMVEDIMASKKNLSVA